MSRLTHFCVRETCMNDLPTPNYPDYNHTKYGDKPGQLWTADERFLLLDMAAFAFYGATPNNPANNITVIIYLTFPFILKL